MLCRAVPYEGVPGPHVGCVAGRGAVECDRQAPASPRLFGAAVGVTEGKVSALRGDARTAQARARKPWIGCRVAGEISPDSLGAIDLGHWPVDDSPPNLVAVQIDASPWSGSIVAAYSSCMYAHFLCGDVSNVKSRVAFAGGFHRGNGSVATQWRGDAACTATHASPVIMTLNCDAISRPQNLHEMHNGRRSQQSVPRPSTSIVRYHERSDLHASN